MRRAWAGRGAAERGPEHGASDAARARFMSAAPEAPRCARDRTPAAAPADIDDRYPVGRDPHLARPCRKLPGGGGIALDVLVGERNLVRGHVFARRAAGAAPGGPVDRHHRRRAGRRRAAGGVEGGAAGAGIGAGAICCAAKGDDWPPGSAASAAVSNASRDIALRRRLSLSQQLAHVGDVDAIGAAFHLVARLDHPDQPARPRPGSSPACRWWRRCPPAPRR